MKPLLKLTSQLLQKELDPAFARRAKFFASQLNPPSRAKILDLGCGRGFYEQFLQKLFPDCRLTAVDKNRQYLKEARRHFPKNLVKFLPADAAQLPFPGGSFDRVLCSEVLEHLPDDNRVIREIFRVLKNGGECLISVPAKNYPFCWDPLNFILEKTIHRHLPSRIWWLAGIWADHQRLYGEKELLDKLKQAGFKIKKSEQATFYALPFAHLLLYGIGKNLVEKGWVAGDFNRFDLTSPPSLLLRVVKLPFQLIDHLNGRQSKGRRFMNLLVKIQKPY